MTFRPTPPIEPTEFASWDRYNLEKFAADTYNLLKEVQTANTQLHEDFKEAMAQNRRLLAEAGGQRG